MMNCALKMMDSVLKNDNLIANVKGTNPGRTYRFFNGTAVVPFGMGLSYSTFTYAIASAPDNTAPLSLAPVHDLLETTLAANTTFPSLHASADASRAPVKYVVKVTNTGSVDSDDVCFTDEFVLKMMDFVFQMAQHDVGGPRIPHSTGRREGRRSAPDAVRVRACLRQGGWYGDSAPLPGADAVHAGVC